MSGPCRIRLMAGACRWLEEAARCEVDRGVNWEDESDEWVVC